MKRARVALVTVLTLASTAACNPFGAETADPGSVAAPTSADEVLVRYVDALGGEDSLRTLKQRTMEATLVFEPEPGCEEGSTDCVWKETRGSFLLQVTADGRLYRRMVVGDNVHERGFDGTEGWQYQIDPPLLILDDETQRIATREDAQLHWYLDSASRQIKPRLLTPRAVIDEAQGRTVELDGLAWEDAEGNLPERQLWFDRSTGLLYEEIEKDEVTGEEVRRTFSDYREVDGVNVQHRIVQTAALGDRVQKVIMSVDDLHHRPAEERRYAVPAMPAPEPREDEILALLNAAKAEAEANPKSTTAQVGLARLAYVAAHFDDAVAAANAALKLQGNEPEALYIKGRVELLQGKLSAAGKSLSRAAKAGLRPDQVSRQLAWIKLRKGDFKAAGKLLADASILIGPGPNDVIPMADLAKRYESFEGSPLRLTLNSCETRIPFAGSEGVPAFEVTADGEKFRVLLDTGAADLIVGETLARKMVVGTDAAAPIALGGPPVPHGQLDEVQLGDAKLANVPVVVFPDEHIEQMSGARDIAGVIGMRALSRFQITVDQREGWIELVKDTQKCSKQLKQRRAGKRVTTWIHETHYLYVMAQMNDTEGLYLVNTGLRGAALTATEEAFARAGIGAPPLRAGEAALVSVDKFSLAEGESSSGLTAAFGYLAQSATSDGFRLDGMIGLDALGGGRWTVDLRDRAIYIHPDEAVSETSKPSDK